MAPRLLNCFGKGNHSSASASGNQVHEKGKSNVTVDASAEEQRRAGAIMVELFSSQGCATSPEAELLVSRLARGDFALETPVIVLAFHVDYWDYMGWKDPYGSSQWTVRQKAYVEALKLDTIFTPQVVIQGRTQCVANEEEALLSSIMSAPKFPSPTFQVSFALFEGLTYIGIFIKLKGEKKLLTIEVCFNRQPSSVLHQIPCKSIYQEP